ncbi:MAG: tRNA (adenosine(37)-N6)-dimethylallyltransferase MiaA [Bacteroidota bacterium]
MQYDTIIILGPTASGKTRLAAQLAHQLHTEIISVDSRQVYKDMNIGTGKDYSEYTVDGKKIPVHLIDIKEAGEKYHIDAFKKDFFAAVETIRANGKMSIACGGTGLYLDSVLRNFAFTAVPIDAGLRNQLMQQTREALLQHFSEMPVTSYTPLADTSTTKRLIRAIEINTFLANHSFTPETFPELHPLVIGLDLPVTIRRKKIEDRLNYRLQHGLIEEVIHLRERISDEQLEYYGLEYKFITLYLQGKYTLPELQQRLTTAIQQFAKRQMTYFRKMERDGLSIHWIDAALPVEEQLKNVSVLLDR